jgi:D-proline reductase (dithiol) PrdB
MVPTKTGQRSENEEDSEADRSPSRPADSVRYIDRTKRLYSSQRPYRWAENDRQSAPPPWTPIEGELKEQRVALISSGGVHHAGHEPFHFRNDTSHREIPLETPAQDLRVSHFGYDTTDAKVDPACVLPIRALSELAAAGEIGSAVDPALSFMGGIYSQRLVREEVAPRFRDFVLHEQADLVLLVPV